MYADPKKLNFLSRVIRSGIQPDMPYHERRRIMVTNMAGLLGGTCSLIFLVSNYFSQYYLLCILDFLTLCAGYSIPIFHIRGINRYPAVFAVVLYSLCCTYSAYHYHNAAEYFLLLFIGVSFVIWDDKRLTIPLAVLNMIFFLTIQLSASASAKSYVPLWNKGAVLVIILSLYIYFLHYFSRQNRKYQQRIENQNKELQHLNMHKEKILSVLYHDIKSPIANVYASLTLLKEEIISPSEFSILTNKMLYEIGNLQLNITGLLEWSKNQFISPAPKKEHFGIREILSSTLTFLNFQYEAKEVRIDSTQTQDVQVNADRNQVEVILRNLLSNAIKFSYPGSAIEVSTFQENKFVAVRVKDYGKGIPETALEKLFDPGELVTTYGTSNEKGTGLGLKLCQEFARQNNGWITVKSDPGKGSAFTLFLPAGVEAQTALH